jgi:hypothetical protein
MDRVRQGHVIGVLNIALQFEQVLFVGVVFKRDLALQVGMFRRNHRPFAADGLHKIPALSRRD